MHAGGNIGGLFPFEYDVLRSKFCAIFFRLEELMQEPEVWEFVSLELQHLTHKLILV